MGGSQNLRNEPYLSKTPCLTFVHLSKCNIKLPVIFWNSKKMFLWSGLDCKVSCVLKSSPSLLYCSCEVGQPVGEGRKMHWVMEIPSPLYICFLCYFNGWKWLKWAEQWVEHKFWPFLPIWMYLWPYSSLKSMEWGACHLLCRHRGFITPCRYIQNFVVFRVFPIVAFQICGMLNQNKRKGGEYVMKLVETFLPEQTWYLSSSPHIILFP